MFSGKIGQLFRSRRQRCKPLFFKSTVHSCLKGFPENLAHVHLWLELYPGFPQTWDVTNLAIFTHQHGMFQYCFKISDSPWDLEAKLWDRKLVPQTVTPAGLSAKIQFLPAGAPVVLTISSLWIEFGTAVAWHLKPSRDKRRYAPIGRLNRIGWEDKRTNNKTMTLALITIEVRDIGSQ